MGFLGNLITGALPGVLSGNLPAAIAGGLTGAFGGGGQTLPNITGYATNTGLGALEQGELNTQFSQIQQQMQFQDQLNWQSQYFNEMADQKSENMRESNVLRDIAMAQRKADNSITKEFIGMIKE